MRLDFDRGTILLREPPAGLELADVPGVRWDPRVGAHRAPARLAYPIAAELRRRGVRIAGLPGPALGPPSGVRPPELRPYQEAALAAWRLGGRRGVVVLPTGSGKTRIALAAIAATRTACLCLVPTRALLEQWLAALRAVGADPVGRFGDGERVLAPVTVATFASAYRHMPAIGDRFGLLVVDEAHHFGRAAAPNGLLGSQDDALEMSIAPLRLGLTATPPPAGAAAARLAALVGPVVFERSVGDLAGRTSPRSSASPGAWLSRPTSAGNTTPCGTSTGGPGALFKEVTSAPRGRTSSTTPPAPTTGGAASPPGAGPAGCSPSPTASARPSRCCSRATARSGRWCSRRTTTPPTGSRASSWSCR